MDWRVKGALRRCVLAMPRGERLYRWLTAEVIGTNAGMAYKWFRVFPTHIRILQEHFGDQARAQSMWCLDCGATMAAGLATALATDEPGLMTDRADRLSDRYCAVSRRALREKGPEVAALSGAPTGRLERLLEVTSNAGAKEALSAMGVTYFGSHEVADADDWVGTVGCVFTAGALEHYRPEALELEVARMARALRSGGVMSHVVDHRDHRWHADKGLSPLAHLTLDQEAYLRRFDTPLDYHNRWLQSRYVELLSRHGFRVECHAVISYTPDLPPLPREVLAGSFRAASEEDLSTLVTHFVAVRA